jgi:hypothetical protein
MSFEIVNDSGAEPLRDVVSRIVLELLGPELAYGRWKVTLRSEGDGLFVLMTGPGEVRQEWRFGRDADAAADLALALRRRLRRGADGWLSERSR